MLRSIFLLLISLAVLTGCGNNDIIPEKDMVKILYRMHLIDGTLSMPSSINGTDRLPLDSVDHYGKMFESYGYTSKQFSNSYYHYLGRPDILDGIYDRVIAKLEVENQRIEDSLALEVKMVHYWNLSSNWRIVDSASVEMIEYSIPITRKGTYTLKMVAIVGKNDQTPNLKAIVGTTSNVSTTIDKLDNRQELSLKKTGRFENYTFTITVPENKQIFIKGRLLDFTREGSKKYARSIAIKKIILTAPADTTMVRPDSTILQ